MQNDAWMILAPAIAIAVAVTAEGLYWALARRPGSAVMRRRGFGTAFSLLVMGVTFYAISEIPEWTTRTIVTVGSVAAFAYFRSRTRIPKLLGAPEALTPVARHDRSRALSVDMLGWVTVAAVVSLVAVVVGGVLFPEVRTRALILGAGLTIPVSLLLRAVCTGRRGR